MIELFSAMKEMTSKTRDVPPSKAPAGVTRITDVFSQLAIFHESFWFEFERIRIYFLIVKHGPI